MIRVRRAAKVGVTRHGGFEHAAIITLAGLGFGNALPRSLPLCGERPAPVRRFHSRKLGSGVAEVSDLGREADCLAYDAFTGERPNISQGRIYYEQPNIARYEIREGGNGKVNDWLALPEVWLWNGKETLWIDGRTRECRRYDWVDLQAMQGNAGRKSLLFFAPFLAPIIVRLQRPQEAWPLLIDIRAADMRQQFDVTVEGRNNKEILLRALPETIRRRGQLS